jgi:Raf kinase inhibitor-like YbhB/YbcL family protein
MLAQAGLVLVGCSSDGDNGTSGGAAGSMTVGGGGNASAGSASTAGSTNGGNATTAGNGGAAGSATAGQAGNATSAGSGGASGGTGGSAGSGGASGGSGGTGGASGGSGGTSNQPFALTSTAFKEGEEIPLKYKCDKVNPMGMNQSPPLSWGPGPAGTKSYAVVLIHVTTPEHWVIWDIPANVLSLPENIEHSATPAQPAGSKQSLVNLDGFQGSGYLGPCPQAVGSQQDYRFTLYALDVETLPGLSATSNPTQAAMVVKQHLVAGSQGVSLTGHQIRSN